MFVPLTTRTGFAALRLQNPTRMRTQPFYLFGFNSIAPIFFQNIHTVCFEKIGRGRRNRTLIRGFGDRYSTVELCPCDYTHTQEMHHTSQFSLRQDSTPLQKIKRKYYNIFHISAQEHFLISLLFSCFIFTNFSLAHTQLFRLQSS